jgi:hypothetical protein
VSSSGPRPSRTRRASPIWGDRRDDEGRAATNPDGMIAMINASVLRLAIAGSILFAATCAPAAAASSPPEMSQFDGNYKGALTIEPSYYSSVRCEFSKIEQVMSVSGNQVYLERKSAFPGVAPLLLSGTVSPDGSVSAAGITREQSWGPSTSIFFALTGKIENNQFKGELVSRFCNYSIVLKR